ncbi:MAG: SsrA-binding protein [Deltaproteobacteria bacterium]|nr:SsrA-binding protein [Deltaproteobacteria bacterium]
MNRVLEVNKDLKHRFEIIECYDAGIQLLGYEVKSIKRRHFSLDKAYVKSLNGELWLVNMHIKSFGPWTKSENRPRKLLLNKNEITRLITRSKEKGLTIIPYQIYINDRGLIKVQIALVKAKKIFERRQEIKKRETERELQRIFKR